MKRKIARAHRLTFEELNTIIVEAEATLNSRPLLIATRGWHASFNSWSFLDWTPAAFTTSQNRCGQSDPRAQEVKSICLKLSSELWKQWSSEYLQSLQVRKKPLENL